MTVLRTLKKLLFGETWLLPIGLLAAFAISLLARRALDQHWARVGGFVLLAGVAVVLLAAVARTARRR
jgi:membrane protein implicated in regulation of membrane protease activity